MYVAGFTLCAEVPGREEVKKVKMEAMPSFIHVLISGLLFFDGPIHCIMPLYSVLVSGLASSVHCDL